MNYFLQRIQLFWEGVGEGASVQVSDFFYEESKSKYNFLVFFWGGGRGEGLE